MHILIAEDEQRIARFMEKGLTANGYTCTVVHDGIAALDLASTGEADLLILDVGLPRMDGFTVLRNLRDLGADLPIIMVTARTAVEDTVEGFESGANDYISKPFRFEELLARVRVRIKEPTAAGRVPPMCSPSVISRSTGGRAWPLSPPRTAADVRWNSHPASSP